MPPLPLTTLLHTALPRLTPRARAVVSALGACNGEAPPAGELAAMVGMHSRYQLARLLRREGLPPLEELAAWARVLYWMHEAASRHGSLRDLARRAAVARVLLVPWPPAGSVSTGAVPTRLVLSQAGTRAYVTNQFTEDIGVIDLHRSRQIAAIAVPGHPMAVVLSRDGRTLFVTTNLDQLYAIPLGAGSTMACAAVPNACAEMALDPSGTRLYVPTWRAGTVLEVELPALRVTRTIRVGGKVQGLSVPRVGGTLFVANEDGWLDVIRLSTGARLARLDLGSPAFAVAVSPDDGAAYVSLPCAGRVVVVNPLTLGVVAVLQPGGTPRER